MAISDITTSTPTTEQEEWRDIPGYEGVYQVSASGLVRRIHSRTSGKTGHVLSPRVNNKGYQYVNLSLQGETSGHSVHSLVALAFIGKRPFGLQINHRDGDPVNNHYQNLEYCTQSQNMSHAFAHNGRKPVRVIGENNPSAKLTDADVRDIRQLLRLGVSQRQIANRFGVACPQINRIAQGKGWKHVE